MRRVLRLAALILLGVCLSYAARAQGTWSSVQSVAVPGMTHGQMFYQVLLLNYTGSGVRSPMLVYEHENSEGDKCYDGSAPCTTLTAPIAAGGSGVQDWYNTASFQARYCVNGCIVVSVAADQTSDPSGQNSNFGGYNDSPGSEPNERGVIAVIQQLLNTLNADPNRVYVTGDSLGGIGSQAIALDYGIKTGSQGQIITATMPFSGGIFRGGLNAPTNTQTGQIQGGGLQLNVNGVGDTGTSSNPALWTEPVWRAITGNSNYPGPPAGAAAASSPYHFLLDTGLGHDVWDTYRPMPTGTPLLDLLFAANAGSAPPSGGTLTGTPRSPMPSGYFHTVGNQIQDGGGNNVRLACTGYNSQTANKPSDMAIIRAQGFNCVRVPWYDALDFPGGAPSFGRMDTIVNAASGQNLRVILDHHSNEGVSGNNFCTSQQANGLWYDLNSNTPVAGIVWNSTDNTDGCGTTGTVTYAQFRANWVAWVTHYAANQTVMGADLDNEPTTYCHLNNGTVGNSCGAKWGSNDGTDLKAAANDVGGAILAVNPNWLISVTGIINSGNLFNGTVKGSAAYPVTVGEPMDLSTVQSSPLTCCAGHVIFSIHEYPTSISGQQPDSGPNATTLRNAAWGLVVKNNFAPLFIGEMGASLDGTNGAGNLADEQAWAASMTQYINGQMGSQGGPTFTGCQQPISTDWWNFGNNAGEAPDGTLNADGSNRAGQQAVWSTLLFTTCSTTTPPVTPTTSTTWNPNDSSPNITLSANLLTATTTAIGSGSVRSTTSQSSGDVCFDITATTISTNWDVGISSATFALGIGGGLGVDTNGIGFDPASTGGAQGIFFNNSVLSSGATASVSGDVVTICADLTNKQFWATSGAMRGAIPFSSQFSAQFGTGGGTVWNSNPLANPATGVGGLSFAGMSCPCFITYNNGDASGVGTMNPTGPFAVPLPAGFVAWQQPVAVGGHPTILIFGANDDFPYANDNGAPGAFAQPVNLR